MSVRQMQQQLINQISAIKNEDTLRSISEQISYSIQNEIKVEDLLTEQDYQELVALANEPDDKDTISLKEFNSMTHRWRMK